MSYLDNEKTQTIFRTHHDKENPYAIINKKIFYNSNLSLAAKGLLGYCLSKPDTWVFLRKKMLEELGIGREKLASLIKELKNEGYIRIEAIKENGRFVRWITHVYETPISNSLSANETENPCEIPTDFQDTKNPYLEQNQSTENPDLAKPDPQKPVHIVNTDPINKRSLVNNDVVVSVREISNEIEKQKPEWERRFGKDRTEQAIDYAMRKNSNGSERIDNLVAYINSALIGNWDLTDKTKQTKLMYPTYEDTQTMLSRYATISNADPVVAAQHLKMARRAAGRLLN